jgi:hypothetical protein
MFFKGRSIFFAALLLLFSFCKEPVISDSDLIPQDKLGIEYTDTLTLVTEVVREDSLRTDELAINVLGNMNDAVFGKSNASIYFQLKLQTNTVDLGTSLQLDSAILMLQYAGSYGNTKVPQNIVVYELDELLYKDSIYFSNKQFVVKPTEIGRKNNFVPNFSDSVNTRYRKYAPHLRVKLDPTWATNLMNQLGTGNVASSENFTTNYLKGLYIKAEENAGGKGMAYLDLKAGSSTLLLYYKNAERDTTLSLIVNNDAATVSHFKHDYASSVAEQFLQGNRMPDSLILLQSLAGLKTKVTVPHLKNLGKISINKAELMVTNFKNNLDIASVFAVPGRLTINASDSLEKNTLVEDQVVSDSYFGGEKVIQTSPNNSLNKYNFNLAVYYQKVIDGSKEDYGLYILTFPSSRIADRLIAGGGNHSKYPLKLKLTYTKIN